jgi:hypothetical protein
MIAHLQNGELDGRRILQEDTALQMHSQLYSPDPRLKSGMAHGFLEGTDNGQRILWHDGSLITFLSALYLIPGQDLGLFIATNSTSGAAAIRAFDDAFLDRYYPAPEASDPQSAPGFAERIAPYLGEYTLARSNFTSFERMNTLVASADASLGSDDALVLSVLGQVIRFAEVEPGLLQDIGDPARQLVYRTGPDGRLYLMNGTFAMVRTPWYGSANLHRLLFLSGTVLFLGALIAWPIGFFAARRKRAPASQPAPLPARLARWAAALFGLLWLVSLLGIVSIFANILPGFGVASIQFETPPQLTVLLSLTYVLIGLASAMLGFAVLGWVRRYWSLGGRIFYTLLALVALLLTWALVYWNLLL